MIVNDPIYGFIEIPEGIIFDLLEHPFYQRLRRISQLGLAQYVYPGAVHSRFNHTIGALHLMRQTLSNLQQKGIVITPEEVEAASIAILLHDLGHSPFSHSLEFQLIDIPHEALSIAMMEQLNTELKGRLTLALRIFKNEYPKKFLSQLVSGQLDMDRLDYLTRDSFFTGVAEGRVGYEHIIKMLNVHNDELVVEHKGIYSVEGFLIARRLMYWQVYLHKNVICASEMLTHLVQRARYLMMQKGLTFGALPPSLVYFLGQHLTEADLETHKSEILKHYIQLDDYDLWYAIKIFAQHEDKVLSFLANGLLNRKLLKIQLQNKAIEREEIEPIRQKVMEQMGLSDRSSRYLVFTGKEANKAYDTHKQEILILLKNNQVQPISEWREHNIHPKEVVKHYLCYPKHLS